MKIESPVSIFENTLALRILLVLYREGDMFRSTLYNRVAKGTNTARYRVDELLEAGLLTEEVSQFPPLSKRIGLTEKGCRVAEHVVAIEEIMNER